MFSSLKFFTSTVRKCLCRKWSCLWMVIVLVGGGVAVQNIFLLQAREDRLDPGKDKITLLSFLQNVMRSSQPYGPTLPSRTGDLHQHQNLGSPNPEEHNTPNSLDETFQNSSSEPTCSPKSHIVFMKTHKTGSSTIQNILYRYGDSRGLTFALPKKKNHRFFYPMLFQSEFVERGEVSMRDFHIMCNHMRFRKSEVSKVMPKDTFYFSILRHPVPMMESMFMYFRGVFGSVQTQSLDEFLDRKLENSKMSTQTRSDFSHNNLAFDLGYENSLTADAKDLESRAGRVIAGIERDFQLVLINEYFDESMILLKNALCWSLQDVVSFKLNGRSDQNRQPVPEDTAEKIQRWNALDWRIYLHFNASFWEKVRSVVGEEEMKKEVSELRKLQAELTDICLRGGEAVNPSQIKEAGLKPFQGRAAVIMGYNLNPDLDQETEEKCRKLITPELQYTLDLYNRQFPKKVRKK